jgi:hypothetical protein
VSKGLGIMKCSILATMLLIFFSCGIKGKPQPPLAGPLEGGPVAEELTQSMKAESADQSRGNLKK